LLADPNPPKRPNSRRSAAGSASRPSSMATSATRPQSMASESGDLSSELKPSLSRGPSLRVTSRSASALERKVSVARRSSLPSISQRQSLALSDIVDANDAPLRVTVKAGTLDVLVDVLIRGIEGVSVSFADDHGEMPLNARSRPVKLDKTHFEETWWNTFRSFVTPLVFFEVNFPFTRPGLKC
jgi:hypothetical protein